MGPASAAAEADTAAFFHATPLSIYVGGDAGGGFDLYTRVLARHMPRHIPGNPTAVVKNVPGAGGLKMVDYIYQSAPRDGSAFGTSSRTFVIEPMLGNKAATYDPRRLRAIGSISPQTPTCAVWHKAPVRTLADAKSADVLIGAEAINATVTYPAILNAVLGTRFRIVSGYKGTPSIMTAIERGEVEGVCLSWDTLKTMRPEWMANGTLRPIVRMTHAANPELPRVPSVFDGVRNPDDAGMLAFFFAPDEMGRPYFAPPDLPEERLAALRRAFDETMRDPDFIADGAKINVAVDPMSGEAMEALIAGIADTPQPIVDRVIKVLASLRYAH
ncbi:MAG TPA: tripartite tricarboxylate transporter substrate-binding protein [Alphaproteobacteria bacterium]|nr:tripartite tricarboxylate transporter substrate-binding protein [Alphaproteobacteria bacterium]